MANNKVEEQLKALKALRGSGLTPDTLGPLKKSLHDKINLVVAKAAQLSGELAAHSLMPELQAAFTRMFEPGKDPQCWAKNALAKTLKDLGLTESALFLRGLRHIQMEPVWGGSEDTATTLRGACALALVQCNDLPRDEILRHLLNSVTEKSPVVRIDAVRALEQMGGFEVVLLLRLKALTGDADPRVTGEILDALLHMEGEQAISFAANFLKNPDEEVADEAAIALAASHLPGVFPLIKQAWENRPSNTFLRAMSISRLPEALDFLLNMLKNGRPRDAEESLHALELQKSNPEVVKKVEEALCERADAKLHNIFRQRFIKDE